MSRTLLSARTGVRRYISDTNAVTWQNNELDKYINDGQKFLLSEILKVNADYMLARATTSTVSGQSDYETPSNMYGNKFRGLWVYTAAAAQKFELSLKSSDHIIARQHISGIPRYYSMIKDAFLVTPVPDSVYTLELWYTSLPADLGDDADVFIFNDEEIDVIELWASIRAKNARVVDLGNLPELMDRAVMQVRANIIPDDNLAVEYKPLDMS